MSFAAAAPAAPAAPAARAHTHTLTCGGPGPPSPLGDDFNINDMICGAAAAAAAASNIRHGKTSAAHTHKKTGEMELCVLFRSENIIYMCAAHTHTSVHV